MKKQEEISRTEKWKFWINVLALVFLSMGIIDFFLRKQIRLAIAEYLLAMLLFIIYFYLKIKSIKKKQRK